jgi:hypothetical protein
MHDHEGETRPCYSVSRHVLLGRVLGKPGSGERARREKAPRNFNPPESIAPGKSFKSATEMTIRSREKVAARQRHNLGHRFRGL